jgi:hypothetical protein
MRVLTEHQKCVVCGKRPPDVTLFAVVQYGYHVCKEHAEQYAGASMEEVGVPVETCPFCVYWAEETQPIADDFFGTPAKIGDIRCCEACQQAAAYLRCEAELVQWYEDRRHVTLS